MTIQNNLKLAEYNCLMVVLLMKDKTQNMLLLITGFITVY